MKLIRATTKADRSRAMWTAICAFCVAYAISLMHLTWLTGPALFAVWLIFAAPLLVRLAKLYRIHNRYTKGEFAEVLRLANKDVLRNPKDSHAYAALATAYIGTHDSQAALDAAEKACALENDHPRHFMLRAIAHFQQQSHEEALADVNKAIELAPFRKRIKAQLLGTRATVYLGMHKVSLAMTDCDEALKLFPKTQVALLNRAYCFATQRQFAKASEDLDEVEKSKVSPLTKALVLNHRAVIAIGVGKLDEAETQILEAMALMPTLPTIIATHGLVLLKQQRCEQAIDEFNRALEIDKYLAYAYWYRYRCYEAMGNAERADLDKRTAENFGYKPFDFLENTALLS